MTVAPVFVDEDGVEWEGWPAHQVAERGTVQWRTLVSGGRTPSRALTAGTARIGAGGSLRPHRHAQAEIYRILQGAGRVTINGRQREVGPGTTVFIPGDAVHGIQCAGDVELRFTYVLAADRFEDVAYIFDV
jgi:mannose-6-phosphate isomerase-like protein (cupin superfamily)